MQRREAPENEADARGTYSPLEVMDEGDDKRLPAPTRATSDPQNAPPRTGCLRPIRLEEDNYTFYLSKPWLSFLTPGLEDRFCEVDLTERQKHFVATFVLLWVAELAWIWLLAIKDFFFVKVHMGVNEVRLFFAPFIVSVIATVILLMVVFFRRRYDMRKHPRVTFFLISVFNFQCLLVIFFTRVSAAPFYYTDASRYVAVGVFMLILITLSFLTRPPFRFQIFITLAATSAFSTIQLVTFRQQQPVYKPETDDWVLFWTASLQASTVIGVVMTGGVLPVFTAIICNMFSYNTELFSRRVFVSNFVLSKVAQQLRHAHHTQKEMLENISHDLRDPLNVIIGHTERLLDADLLMSPSSASPPGGVPPTPLEGAAAISPLAHRAALSDELRSILSTAAHIKSMVDDLLELSKLESGSILLTQERMLMPDLIEEVVSGLDIVLRQRNLYVVLSTYLSEKASLPVVGAPMRLRQVLTNLVSNACKFTARDGDVAIVVDVIAETDEQSTVLFKVFDTGLGISKQNMGRLFARFSQLPSDAATQGYGLGLAACHLLVKLMRGSITVDSVEGKGSCFSVVLPFRKQLPESDSDAPRGDTERADNKLPSATLFETGTLAVPRMEHLVGKSTLTLERLHERWIANREEAPESGGVWAGPPVEDRPTAYLNRLCLIVGAGVLSDICLDLYLSELRKMAVRAPTAEGALGVARRLVACAEVLSSACYIFVALRRTQGNDAVISARSVGIVSAIAQDSTLCNHVRCVLLVPSGVVVQQDAALDFVSVLRFPLRRADLTDYFANPDALSISTASRGFGDVLLGGSPKAPRSLAIEEYSTLAGRHVLVVEDHLSNRRMLEGTLASCGVVTTAVDNGARAIELCQTQSFDLILMDIYFELSDLDGLQATRAIRKAEQSSGRPPVPIVAVTGNAYARHDELALAAGMNAVLHKPFYKNQLLALVKQLIVGDARNSSGSANHEPSPSDPDVITLSI